MNPQHQMIVETAYIEAIHNELNKRKIRYAYYGFGLFVFECFTEHMSASEILVGLKKQKAAKQVPAATKIVVNSQAKLVITGLRNLTPGAWSRQGSESVFWVYETPKDSFAYSTTKVSTVAGVQIFNPSDRRASFIFGSISDWDSDKFEYLGDNITVSFAVGK